MQARKHDPLLRSLQSRFDQHPQRHPEMAWEPVLARLQATPAALAATGGEPDVIG